VGLLSPTLAAFIHITSELASDLNSARLLPRTKQGTAADDIYVVSEEKFLPRRHSIDSSFGPPNLKHKAEERMDSACEHTLEHS
jgi:hypothetical protein